MMRAATLSSLVAAALFVAAVVLALVPVRATPMEYVADRGAARPSPVAPSPFELSGRVMPVAMRLGADESACGRRSSSHPPRSGWSERFCYWQAGTESTREVPGRTLGPYPGQIRRFLAFWANGEIVTAPSRTAPYGSPMHPRATSGS